MECPSYVLMATFCLARLVASIIAGFANWGFPYIQKISADWIGIVWVCVSLISVYATYSNASWAEYHLVHSSRLDQVRDEASVIKYLRDRHNEATSAATCALADTSIPMTWTQLHIASIHE